MSNKEKVDKDVKLFYEKFDVVSKEHILKEMTTAYIDLITDGKPNSLIYGTLKAKQETEEKQELANYYSSIFESILIIYNNVYRNRERKERSFDSLNLIVTTNLKDAFINSLILANTEDENATKINPKSKLYVDKEALTLERLTTKKGFVGIRPIKNIFNSLYYEYGQALADLTILRIIGKALNIELINQDEIIDYWSCATFGDLSNTIDKLLYVLEDKNKDNTEYKKSEFYIDLITTKAIDQKISILLDSDQQNKKYTDIEKYITNIVLKEVSKTKIDDNNYASEPYELTTSIRRNLIVYYWNRIKDEIRAIAESEANNGK